MTEDQLFDALKYRTYDAVLGAHIWRNDAGQIHRDDGPAVEYNDGSKSWWVDGKFQYSDIIISYTYYR